tara:strand:+ start:153767 stop:155197 length:1431 start_codon:yes stop_codon:yes gene_type:complete
MSSKILSALNSDITELTRLTQNALQGGNGGELYLADAWSFAISMSLGIVTAPDISFGAGGALRRINDATADMLTFASLDPAYLKTAAKNMQGISQGTAPSVKIATAGTMGQGYYTDQDILGGVKIYEFQPKAEALMREIDAYARKDSRVTNVGISLSVSSKDILIVRADGKHVVDKRPMSSLNVSVTLEDNGKKENGGKGMACPVSVDTLFNKATWQKFVDHAINHAHNNLTAIDAPSGDDFDLIVANGWGGVIMHEAFGHGLEADFHQKGIAAFQGMLGQRIASKGVTIIDDGTIQNARGSLNVDDEGNPTNRNILVDDGILVGLMTSEISAAKLGMPVTGNARRQGYAYQPIPRMTNTFIDNGNASVEDLIAGVKKGILVTEFGGGQVDITSGTFEFNTTQARLIQNGKLGAYIKGASLCGQGKTAFQHITGVANDLEISVTGSCGKDGQSLAVTVGQPTIAVGAGAITVGGTA